MRSPEITENKFEISENVLEEIKKEVNEPFEWRYFSIEDIDFALILSPSKNEDGTINGTPAEVYGQPGEFAIYIWEDLPENIQRVLLFHEIVEIYLYKTYHIENIRDAHLATLEYEDAFKRGVVSDEEDKQLKQFRIDYPESSIS